MKYDFYMQMLGLSIGVFFGIISEYIGYGKYLILPAILINLYLKYGKVKID